jgi:N-acetylglutamate synthase-like GNAT family acetyltransferase
MRSGKSLNNSTLIRQASKPDVPFIYRLQRQMSAEDGIYGFVAETAGQIEKAINPYFLVAETNGGIIGFISGGVSAAEGSAVIPKDEKYLEIENLYVAPRFREQGIGGRLVD